MSLAREQLEQLDHAALLDYAESMGDIKSSLSSLEATLVKMEAENEVMKKCNKLLVERADNLEKKITSMEKSLTQTTQYARNRQIELHRFPEDISDEHLVKSVCDVLSLTGTKITPGNLDKCHRLKKKSSVIVEFKYRDKRDPIINGRKNLKNKQEQLKNMNMEEIIISESLCPNYQHYSFLCRKLKKKKRIQDQWFYNGRLFIIIDDGDDRTEIKHICDLHELFGKQYIDDLQSPH